MPTLEHRIHEATNLGLSRFAKWLPILLRVGLLLLFIWYCMELFGSELFRNARGGWVNFFPIALLSLFPVIFLVVMVVTVWKYLKARTPVEPSRTPLWPFLLINLFMIVLVSVIAKWEQHRGSPGFTSGLLGFTQVWVHKIGGVLGR